MFSAYANIDNINYESRWFSSSLLKCFYYFIRIYRLYCILLKQNNDVTNLQLLFLDIVPFFRNTIDTISR